MELDFQRSTLVVYSLLFSYCSVPLAAQSSQSDSPQTALRSEIHSCESAPSLATSCKPQLQAALKVLLNAQHKIMDRHLDNLASAMSSTVSGRKLSSNVEVELIDTIVAVIRDSDLPSAVVLGKLRDLKSVLTSANVPESSRTALVGSLTVVSQDVRGPEDSILK